MGRPRLHSLKDHEDAIIKWISQGKTLRDYCRQKDCPSNQIVYKWLDESKEFSERFARARLDGYDAIAQETLAIADDGQNDWMERLGEDGKPVGWKLNGEHVQRSKLRIETRLKLLAKWDPKRYGEAMKLSGDPENPIVARDLSAREYKKIREELLKKDDV